MCVEQLPGQYIGVRRGETFAGPMLELVSWLMLTMMISIGRRGRLFDAARRMGWVTREQLAVEMLNDAGFDGVTVNTLPHDIQNDWYVMTKPVEEPVAA